MESLNFYMHKAKGLMTPANAGIGVAILLLIVVLFLGRKTK